MTLLINEICAYGDLREGYILTVADRRITYPENHPKHLKPEHQRKIFKIPYLVATVGYFGLAYYRNKAHHPPIPLSDWLDDFINKNHDVATMGEFAGRLQEKLNSSMEKADVLRMRTGFHICGYNDNGFPEFWIVRNSGDDYSKPWRDYYGCKESFLSCDAPKIGYTKERPDTGEYKQHFYINGDTEPFHRVWHSLNMFANGMMQRGDFKGRGPYALNEDSELKEIAKWQMKVIGNFYSKFIKHTGAKIIGGEADVFVLRPNRTLPRREAEEPFFLDPPPKQPERLSS